MSRGDGMRLMIGPSGGRQAARRPMDTSAIVQKLGAERCLLVGLSEGWK